jgi:hypothetical protein
MFSLLEGWKTRLLAIATFALGVVEIIDPALLTTALGFGPQGRAALFLVIGVLIFALRQWTKTPAPPLLKKKGGAE